MEYLKERALTFRIRLRASILQQVPQSLHKKTKNAAFLITSVQDVAQSESRQTAFSQLIKRPISGYRTPDKLWGGPWIDMKR